MADQKKLNDFLTEFFQLAQLKDMFEYHVEQRAQFGDYISKGDLTDNMSKWVKNFIKKDTAGKPLKDSTTGEYSLVDTPDPDTMSDEDWEKLYAICQSVLMQMKKSGALDSDVQLFVGRWAPLFIDDGEHADFVATRETEKQIQDLYDLLDKEPSKSELQKKLSSNGEWAGILGSGRGKRISYAELVYGIRDKKYNKSQEFQDIVYNLVSQISKETDQHQNQNAKDALKALGLDKQPNFGLILDEKGWKPYSVASAKVDEFKQQYSFFLNDIYTNSKVSEEFKKNEGQNNQISTALENAISKTDYNNPQSKDYVYPKRDDKLTRRQQISKWASDTYENSFKKYTTLRGDRLFFKTETMEVFKAINKCGIKPSDGIDKILKEKDKIKTALGHSPKSNEAFDWLAKTLGEFSKDPKMSKALAGALRNGRQMRHLVQEMILTAITESTKKDGTQDEKTIEKVKIAMELLSAIRYSLVTSNIMSALKDQTFSMFSNKDLSWNKNEGVQFVTNALDYTIGFAFRTAGYGVTMGANLIRRSNSKFNGKMQHGEKDETGKRFERAYQNWEKINTANKADAIQRQTDYERAITPIKDSAQEDMNNAYYDLTGSDTPGRDASHVVDRIEDELNTTGLEDENRAFAAYQSLQQELDNLKEIKNSVQNALKIQQKIVAIQMPGNKKSTAYIAAKEKISILAKEQRGIVKELEKNDSFLKDYGIDRAIQSEDFTGALQILNDLINNFENDPNYSKATREYKNIVNLNDKKRNNIAIFRDASKRLNEIEETQKKNDELVNSWYKKHKDYYNDLMNFWDMLDSGKATLTNSKTNETETVNFAHNFALGNKSVKQKNLLEQLKGGYSLDY